MKKTFGSMVAELRRENGMTQLALMGVALAMGIAVAALSIMDKIEMDSAVGMLGIGLACSAVTQLTKKEK